MSRWTRFDNPLTALTVALGILGWLGILLLLATFVPPDPPSPPTPIAPIGTWVDLEDGTSVVCVYLTGTGIDCDWETRSVGE